MPFPSYLVKADGSRNQAVILSVMAFGLGAWWTFIGRVRPADGVFVLSGWCVSAIVFSYRAT